jgi:hypothetical protein
MPQPCHIRRAGGDAGYRVATLDLRGLEAADGFGLPVDIDRSFERLVAGMKAALSAWNA